MNLLVFDPRLSGVINTSPTILPVTGFDTPLPGFLRFGCWQRDYIKKSESVNIEFVREYEPCRSGLKWNDQCAIDDNKLHHARLFKKIPH